MNVPETEGQREEIRVPAGPPIVGLLLLILTAYSLYVDEMIFAMLNVTLMVVLALGTVGLTR